eukprot:9782512-Alexandrium_andersonii.AAC.1
MRVLARRLARAGRSGPGDDVGRARGASPRVACGRRVGLGHAKWHPPAAAPAFSHSSLAARRPRRAEQASA